MNLSLRSRRRLGVAAVLTAATVAPLSLVSTPASALAPPTDRTSPLEARRVDRVKLSKIDWYTCADNGAQCALIRLPLDYDKPNGPTTEIAVARVKAAKPSQRIGTLFVNPGGPGSSSTQFALAARGIFDQRVLDRFDIVGVDPRGVGNGATVRCFKTTREQQKAYNGFTTGFPVTRAEIASNLRASRVLAKACGTTGQPLAGSMSTAEVARDMDVVRRALGDKKLSYLGFSYGTQLGQVYANMFPDRVRSIAIDGVIDPVAWTTGRNGQGTTVPVDDRLRTADGTYKAFRELMLRCDKAGAPACAFAGSGDSLKKFDVLVQRLKKAPAQLGSTKITYPQTVGILVSALYPGDVGPGLANFLQDLYTASDPVASPSRRAAAGRRAVVGLAKLRDAAKPVQTNAQWKGRLGREFPYITAQDSYLSVICSDSVNPKDPNAWVAASKVASRRVPYFGNYWVWASNSCATSIWTARDEDRYMGPFNKRTAKPVLVVGNYYDPATPYTFGAVAAAKLLPNSRLLTSDSWGHTAYGTSTCVRDAIDAYLLQGTLPAKGTICTGPQPFEDTVAPQSMGRKSPALRPIAVRPYVPGLSD